MSNRKSSTAPEAPVRTTPLPLDFPGLHYIDDQEIEAAVRVLRSRSLFRYYGVDLQHEAEQFEAEFAAAIGARHALAVTSGTAALSVALGALGVGPGQEVIIPAYMWVSVAGAVVNQGAIPVLADIDESFGLDARDVARKITDRTSGIIFVHMSGAPADVPAVCAIARARKLFVLEDCAQCNGGSIGGQKVGTFGDVGIFSFQINKTITSGEGGAIVTNDPRLYRRAFACHDVGYSRDESGRLAFDDADSCVWGKGARMDELRAAILRVQLRKLPAITAAMRRSKYRIRQALRRFPEVGLRQVRDELGDTGSSLITIYPDAETASRVNVMLRTEGIVSQAEGRSMADLELHVYYNIPSLVDHASVDGRGFPWNLAENAGLHRDYDRGSCPVADGLLARSILIAIPSCLTERDEDDVIRAFEKTLRSCL